MSAREDECARALHHLAKGFNLPDEGPDENVGEAIKIRGLLVEALKKAHAAVHEVLCADGPAILGNQCCAECIAATKALRAAGVE